SNVGDTIVPLTLGATDADGDVLTFAATGLPSGLSLNSSTGVISGTLAAAAGNYTVTVTASDGSNTSAPVSFTWTVATTGLPSYSIPDLGVLGGTSWSYSSAQGLNNWGDVVGYSTTADGAYHAFLYSGGAMTDLGALGGSGWTFSIATKINDLGQI